ncbi:MAG TPA: radical SAM family heme chaperone HemW [Pyrinomonadaceae bacterium]|jgi:oxygen-independent coproporphyrinogen-3 oxidase
MLPGVYLHIPFCRSRCSYCDFAVSIYQSDLAEKYVDALCEEVQSSKFKVQSPAIDTIYFGGGTPSLLTPKQAEKILRAVFSRFSIQTNAEITMEMNPGTLTPEIARDFRSLGINRASYGAQTFDDDELKRLGRRHSAEDVRKTIDLLRDADFSNVSFDLIAGLPSQSLKDWERNLNEALKLKPEHLSLYLLEIHEGTPLAKHISEGKQPAPDEDLAGEMYSFLLEKIAESNYEQYEISNFCLPGFESRHNSKYWTFDAVYGFGCSAHSFDGEHRRWANVRDTNAYIKLIEKTGGAIVEETVLDEKERRAEFAFLGLRLMHGVCLADFEQKFGVALLDEYGGALEESFEAGLIEIEENRLRLTGKGALFSNTVFAAFV